MLPDRKFVVDTFNLYNAAIFNSRLPLPQISLSRARTFRGKLTYRKKSVFGKTLCSDFEIRVSTLFDLDRKVWEDVVIHEMIHYYIAFMGICDTSSHGPVFRKMMHGINASHNRNITVSSRSTEGKASTGGCVPTTYALQNSATDALVWHPSLKPVYSSSGIRSKAFLMS